MVAGDTSAVQIPGDGALVERVQNGELAYRQAGGLPDSPQSSHPLPYFRLEFGF